MVINLEKFCSEDENRTKINHPFCHNGYKYATDGKIVIRIPLDDLERGISIINNNVTDILKEFSWCEEKEEIKIPTISAITKQVCGKCKGEKTKCPECDGEGEVETWNTYNEYTNTCATCDGDEYIPCPQCSDLGIETNKNHYVDFPDFKMNVFYLNLIKELPELKMYNLINTKWLKYFSFTGGEGLLAVLRERCENK